jgi:hypothetical protein
MIGHSRGNWEVRDTMSTEATPQGFSSGTEGLPAPFAEMLAEMRDLQERIEQNETRADLSRRRTELIWRDIEQLREEMGPLMSELRALR